MFKALDKNPNDAGIVIEIRVESGCIGLEIFGPPHQTKKIFGRSAGIWLKFG